MVIQTGAEGATLNEAKYINVSLFHLEQVIIALQEKAAGGSRSHIPYRNSTMTMVSTGATLHPLVPSDPLLQLHDDHGEHG